MSSETTTNRTAANGRTQTRRRASHAVPAALLFVLFAVAAVVLLLTAAWMLLAGWLNSDVAASAVLGGVTVLLAWGIYMIWMRPAIELTSERLETVWSVAEMTGQAYGWMKEKIRLLKLLAAVLRSKW